MRIKKHKNKNQYYLTEGGVWVRDLTSATTAVDINRLTAPCDWSRLLENEKRNVTRNLPDFSTEEFHARKVVIVSDGYNFDYKQNLLLGLPKDVAIIAVNGALAKWKLLGETRRRIDYYLVNNPYPECMNFFPKSNRYFPRCIASVRTNPEFVAAYGKKGTVYRYTPAPEEDFGGMGLPGKTLDDYRNPICAAVSLAQSFGVERLLLFCCDDSFAGARPAAEPLDNGLFCYPQHRMVHGIIDAMCHWIAAREDVDVRVGDLSSSWKYKNISNVDPENIADFFSHE